MHELHLPQNAEREAVYTAILPQIAAVVADESDFIANMANIAAILKEAFGFFWVGFYRLNLNGRELVLGPFQGTLACTRIALGKGVCGTAAEQQQIIIVPDVEQFEGHIACSSLSRSEIVVPIFGPNNDILGVLDIDSTILNDFDECDGHYLAQIARLLGNSLQAGMA